LRERYQICRQIALTGLNVIYRAIDLRRRRLVVVKIARAQPDLYDRYAVPNECLAREAKMLLRLEDAEIRGPHYVELIERNGGSFLVMSYIPGYSLELLCRYGWISSRRVAKALLSICGLVAQVHRLGFVHHDIKPANILVRPDGSPVLIDWGSACGLTAHRSPGRRTLTPEFASWEQARGEVWRSNDVYALGRTLEALIPQPHALVQALIRRATAAHGQRYTTASAFGRALCWLLALDRVAQACATSRIFSELW
jgi:serine/threonine protein kinase